MQTSHHFASTISVFHVGLRPPGPPTPRDFSTPVRPPYRVRPPSLPCVPTVPPAVVRARPPYRASTNDDVRGHVWTTYAATARERNWTFPRRYLPSEEDGGGRSRTDANDDGDERRTRPGLGGDWREDLGWAATGGDLA